MDYLDSRYGSRRLADVGTRLLPGRTGPRTGQQRTMTASRRRQDLAIIGALPRRIHLEL
jgi:hypothetical protein